MPTIPKPRSTTMLCQIPTSKPSAGLLTELAMKASWPLSPTAALWTSSRVMGCARIWRKISTAIYVLDLGGNVRKDSMRDGIPIGKTYSLVIGNGRNCDYALRQSRNLQKITKTFIKKLYFQKYTHEKFDFLENAGLASNIEWVDIQPNKKNIWLTEACRLPLKTFCPWVPKQSME